MKTQHMLSLTSSTDAFELWLVMQNQCALHICWLCINCKIEQSFTPLHHVCIAKHKLELAAYEGVRHVQCFINKCLCRWPWEFLSLHKCTNSTQRDCATMSTLS